MILPYNPIGCDCKILTSKDINLKYADIREVGHVAIINS